jgi:tetratricopeptide (TPR) repeat protein
MADQTAPVRRRVAVKVLKAGMDTRQFVARFEAERQALAMMDHPNIARIIDGGESRQGRPFLVMELVRGIPITTYCDQENFGTAQRLDLFMKVCRAVQHAHQKGIIHRDLKPGNILVTVEDGAEPVPKVIDFGVAKAADTPLTDKTLFTRFEQMIGTPAYMSPEQAGAQASHDVDTRADIYALGVLLYELLTGTTPIEEATLRGAAFDEVRRILREDDAPRPSARLSSLELVRRTTIAKSRDTESAALGRQLRGDLDWIVMKAIKKDRRRRYDTANALAADVERHLGDEPVSAGPPTVAYRSGKFLRRHKTTVAVAAAMLFLLVTGIAATGWQAIRATAEKRHATEEKQRAVEAEALAEERLVEAEAISSFLTDMFESSKPGEEDGGRTITVVDSLKIAEKKLEADGDLPPKRRAVLQQAIAGVYASLGRHGDAIALREKVLEFYHLTVAPEHPDTLTAMHQLADSYFHSGRRDEALPMREKVLALRRKVLGPEHLDTLTAMHFSAHLYQELNRMDEAILLFEEEFTLNREVHGEEHSTTIDHEDCLARAYESAGRHDRALAMGLSMVERWQKRLARSVEKDGPEHPNTLKAMESLAGPLHETGHPEEALEIRENVLLLRRKVLGPEHPDTLGAMTGLANSLADTVRKDDARTMREEVLALTQKILGSEHPDTLAAMHNLAMNLPREEELAMQEEVLALRYKVLGREHPDTSGTMINLANSYAKSERLDEAIELLEEALALCLRILGPEHQHTLSAMSNLVNLYRDAGRRDEALVMLEKMLPVRSKVSGPRHRDTLVAMGNLAVFYFEAGRKDEALALSEKSVDLSRKVLGSEHPDTLSAMNNLAISYDAADRKDEALAMREEVLALHRKVLGPEHPDTLSAMNNLGNSYHSADRNHEALAMREEVLALRRKVLGPEHPDTLSTMHNLANSYSAADRKDEALAMREEVLALLRKVLGPEHPDTLDAMHNLANSYSDADRHDKALEMREQILVLRSKVNGPEHPHTLLVMSLLGNSYHDTGQNKKALALRKQQLELSRKVNGEHHSDTDGAWWFLTDAYERVGRQDELIELLESEVERRGKELGSDHPARLRAMGNLSISYTLAGRHGEAITQREEVLALRSKALGPEHADTRDARQELADSYEKAGRKEEALELIGFVHRPLGSNSPVVVSVLVPPVSEWRWLHPIDGVDPADAEPDFHRRFFHAGYDDSIWSTGKDAEPSTDGFGYGDRDFTGVDIGTPAEKALGKSAYFRHRFTTEKEFTKLELRCHRDDGIIVYLDGKEVGRDNVGKGDEAYHLPAGSTVGDAAETAIFRLPLEDLILPAGEHVLAISLHNTEAPSSDLRIGGITLVEVE